ncbi:hypothetical protein P7K49_039285 [Saguinus oedipus]|uniref:Uncharacterized protein n=1 Tax=Saguinus oedipus TaxID=9490 RepID=A0ABQ9TH31_SAGOE|nr:hypothetical protein P7K49_039285 [Saguinus oedipus]
MVILAVTKNKKLQNSALRWCVAARGSLFRPGLMRTELAPERESQAGCLGTASLAERSKSCRAEATRTELTRREQRGCDLLRES